MKYIIITLYVCMSFFINCSSVQRYAYNRGLDFLDIFHLGVEKNIYGVSANVDSLVVGLQYRKESKGFGSRYGCLGFYSSSKKVKIYGHVKWTHYSFKIIENVGNSNFINNTEYHESMSNLKRCKHKKINQFIFTLLNDRYSQINECQKTENCIVNSDVRRISYSFLPIELSLGAHYGIRIGINTSEFVDFIYG
ncbi:MAG: hypothetical protein KDK36_16160, partial [Leptospiraceae bacterium]|nr:hypothetical protein [Leptospiraceae bacterium]